MKNLTTVIAFATTIVLIASANFNNLFSGEETMAESIHDFTIKTIDGKEKSLSDYKGKVVLIVNVASKCGYTPQYEGLQDLYEKYKEQGFVVLGFPCNQFRNQEPGTNEEIKDFCTTEYGVTFPMFSKIKVNGDDAHPLYKYLKSEKAGLINDNIKWNFTKFLIDKNGKPLKRFGTPTKPMKIAPDIEEALKG